MGYRGWQHSGCREDAHGNTDRCLHITVNDPTSGAQCDEDFCFDESPLLFDPLDPTQWPAKATRLRDRSWDQDATTIERPDVLVDVEPANSGYLSQVVAANPAGHYVLSWWSRHTGPPGPIPGAVRYRVEVWKVGDSTYPVVPEESFLPAETYERQEHRFTLDAPADLEVRFYPSHAEDNPRQEGARFGDVWIWGAQLEWIDPWRCRNDSTPCEDQPPLAYQEIGASRLLWTGQCPDYDGSLMRQQLKRDCVCPNEPGGDCNGYTAGNSAARCYWWIDLDFPLDRLESGTLTLSHAFAAGNFNYRQDQVAVNLVGTNIRRCEHSPAPGSCAVNAYQPYSLDHYGHAEIASWEDRVSYHLPMARVEHGKALTAEVVLTNPLTSNHSQLLGAFWKSGLRGRPLTGAYMLRIWDTPELDWQAVEDIQIAFRYRHWTRSDRP